MLSSVDLPLPDGPSSTTNSPAYSIEVDAAQRVHLDLAHAVDLADVTRAEDGLPCLRDPSRLRTQTRPIAHRCVPR